MLAIKYQVFIFDPAQNRERQLTAIRPAFTAPGAVLVLLKTLRFEDKDALIFSGPESKLEELLKKVERLDVTDWLGMKIDAVKEKLAELAETLGLAKFEPREGEGDQLVLGDDPLEQLLDYHQRNREEVKGFLDLKYPYDLPKESRELWDRLRKRYKKRLKDPTDTEETREAKLRILYAEVQKRNGKKPFTQETVDSLQSKILNVRQALVDGEEQAGELIDVWVTHLLSDGTLKKSKSQKLNSVDQSKIDSHYEISHIVVWQYAVGKGWNELKSYLLKNAPFRENPEKTALTYVLNKLTKLEVYRRIDRAELYVVQRLSQREAEQLTQQSENKKMLTTLNKMCKLWYKTGKFPEP